MVAAKRITRATIKSFINKNKDRLVIKLHSNFDGMVDCVMPVNDTFRPAQPTSGMPAYTLGIEGVWLVSGSNNYFSLVDDGKYFGYHVSNSCGSFTIAVEV